MKSNHTRRRFPRLRGIFNPPKYEVRQALRLSRSVGKELQRLHRDRDELKRRLHLAAGNEDIPLIRETGRKLARVIDRIADIERLRPPPRPPGEVTMISSWMLRDSFVLCTETPDEGMHFLAGIEVEGVWVATRILRFPYEHRSIVSAVGDRDATHRCFIEAHERGHHLLALIHSHPGHGPDANHPSGEDLRTQRLWELTTSMVGGIWSRDGHIRFFTAERPVTVEVRGNDTEKIDDSLYRIA